MSKKIAVIGECMIELSEKGADVKRGFGGDTLNTSVYIARQVDPAALTVHYVTALGTDSFSQQMLDAWHGMGGRIIITADAHTTDALTYGYEEAAKLAKSAGFDEVQVLTAQGFAPCAI